MPKQNGFCMFMESRRASVVESGVVLTRGRAQLAEIVSDEWAALPHEEKVKFIQMAERFNGRQAKDKQTTLSNNGQPQVRPNPPTDDATAKYLEQRAANRELVLELFKTDAWKTQPIVVCSFNPYFQPADGRSYFPAEIGLATFTLQDGVVDNFGRIINTGFPPLGYGVDVARFVKMLSIPHPAFESEFSLVESLMLILESYLEKYRGAFGTEKFYVFALDSEFEMVSGCLDLLNKKTQFKFPFSVLSLPLYAYLASTHDQKKGKEMMTSPEDEKNSCYATISGYRKAGKALNECFCYPSAYPLTKVGMFMSANEADQIISNSDNYKYYDELCCVYHFKKGDGIQYCALNAANRYAYNILEILTLSNEVEIIPGGHHPLIYERQEEVGRRHGWLAKWGVTTVESAMEFPPELVATITQVQPLPRNRNSRGTGKFKGQQRRVSFETDPGKELPNPEEGSEAAQSYERPRPAYSLHEKRVGDLNFGSLRQFTQFVAKCNNNPYRGTAPSVFQSRGNVTGSAKTEGAQDEN